MEFPLQLNRENVTSVLGAAAATTLVFSALSFTLKKNKKGTKEIPVPESCYPYIGHLLSFGDFPHKQVLKWHRKYGPIINIKMGVQNWICIGDRMLAHELFVQNGSIFLAGFDALFSKLHSHGGRGVLFGDKEHWRDGRERYHSILAPKVVDHFQQDIEREVIDMCNGMIEGTEKEGSVIPIPYLQLCTLNIIFIMTLGKRFETLNDPEVNEIVAMFKKNIQYGGIENDLSNYLPIMAVADWFSNTKAEMKDHFSNCRDRIIKRLMSEALSKHEINFVKTLDDGGRLEEGDKIALLTDLLEAGQETIETVLAWAFAILCARPDLQTRIQDEIDAFIKTNKRIPIFTDKGSLPFCVSTIKETLRYRAPTPLGGTHVLTKDVEISGYFIAKGSTIITSMDSMNFNSKWNKDPEDFQPERFMQDTRTMAASANGKIEERDHISFGSGRRMCPGIYMAEKEIFTVFVHLFARCTIEPNVVDGHAVYPDIEKGVNAGVIFAPEHYHVKFVKRQNAIV